MFTRVLLAIDDSPGSEVATSFATALALHHTSTVHVFHVNEFQVGGRGLTLRTSGEARDLLTRVVTQLRTAGVRATGSCVQAPYRDVAGCIATAARQRAADVIVLGSERRRRLGRLFSPNVRTRTVRLTSLPVITAPSPLDLAQGTGLSMDELVARHVENQLLMPLP